MLKKIFLSDEFINELSARIAENLLTDSFDDKFFHEFTKNLIEKMNQIPENEINNN